MKELIRNRIIIILLMVYLALMVTVAYHGITGDVFNGFYWRSGGYSLFPIPFDSAWFGLITITVFVPLTFFELPVYLIFVGHGVWVFWEVVGILYIIYPWIPFLQSVVDRGRSIIANRLGRSS